MRIMIEPQHSIYRQFRAILQNEGVELVIEPMVFGQIADLAFEFKVGAQPARHLRGDDHAGALRGSGSIGSEEGDDPFAV